MKNKSLNFAPIFKTAALGGAIGFAVMAVIIFIFALLMVAGLFDDSAASLLAVIASAIGALSGGCVAGFKFRKNGLVLGLITALTMIVIALIIRLIFSESFVFDGEFAAIAVCVTVLSVIGALTATNFKIKNNKNTRRYLK